ncbi:MAG TPA: fimbria/pilus outer membrane usher protein [Nitrospirota bacterium]|nr:fimbria/pilus outer membrane usher protein [Nitrospirota bacterium]
MFKKGCAVNNFLRSGKIACPFVGLFFRFTLFVMAAVNAMAIIPHDSQAADHLVVNITVNSVSKGDFFVLRDENGDFFVRAEDYPALGFIAFAGEVANIQGERYIALRSLSGLTAVFDEKKLLLSITAPVNLLQKSVIDLSAPLPSKQNAYFPRENSAFMNYGINYSYGDPSGFESFSVTDRFGARMGDVFFLTDTQYTKTDLSSDFLRLMSSMTYERPKDLQWITAGDMFASSGDLGSTINIGGIGISKVYQMDPYLIKQPTLNFAGAATLPSQVDIYVDGALVGRQTVQPGQFNLQNLNYYGGSRNVELVIKDPFGNEQRVGYPAYFTSALLKKGFQEYSYDIGFLRQQYGTESNDYGKAAFSAFHRYGASDFWTIGASAEGSDGIYNAGVQTSLLIPQAGVVTVELAGSTGDTSNSGSAVSVSHSYQKDGFGSSLLLTTFTRNYATVGSTTGQPGQVKFVENIGASYATTTQGSLSLNYSETAMYNTGSTQVTSATYAYNLSKSLTLSLTTQAVRNNGTDYQVFVSLNYYPAKDVQYTAQYQSTKDGDSETLQLQKATPIGEGVGYRGTFSRSDSASAGTTNSFNPFVQYNGHYGSYSLDSYFQKSAGVSSQMYNLTAAGSVVYAGGLFGFSRPVDDSFSIVQVDKLSGVGVMVNSEEIGKTDSAGRIIIPTMRSYNVNQVNLEDKNIPIEYSMSGINANVLPSPWGGSCIDFDIAKVQAVTGSLFIKQAGQMTPLEFYDVTMTVKGRAFKFLTGKGGEFYFETTLKAKDKNPSSGQQGCRQLKEKAVSPNKIAIPGSYPASFDFEGKTCSFVVAIPPSSDEIIDIGNVICELK